MKQPFVSIIIPAFNEEKVIGRLLVSINNQSYENCEAIVIDDASRDKTAEISKKYTKNVFTRKHAERSVQRNFGAKKAKGSYLLFLDGDMELLPNVVKKCVSEMQRDKKLGAIALPEIPVANTFWEKVKAHERSIYSIEGDPLTDAPRFFRRDAFEIAGGYDETITGPEDWDLPETIEKLGYKRKWIKAYIRHYERIPSLWNLWKKKYYYGLGSHTYLSKQNISTVSPKTVYFLRPVFYKNWRRLVTKPILTFAMIIMLTGELLAGGAGYLAGRYK